MPGSRAARSTSTRRRRPPAHPLRLLGSWLRRARRAGVEEAEAAALATVGPRGRPAVRFVLVRGVETRGLVFYTNYRSRKGRELETHPRAALVFYWPALARQVRVEGRVRRTSAAESDLYFAGRPRSAGLAAWASLQSQVIPGRSYLLRRFAAARRKHRGRIVPRPSHWGGFRLEPDAVEFWRNRPHRLHERVRYERRSRGWRRAVLAP